MLLWFLWLPSLSQSASLTFSPSECACGWAMWAYVLEMNKWKALPKEKSISWLETCSYFWCAYLYRCAHLHLFLFEGDKERIRQRHKSNMKTRPVFVEGVILSPLKQSAVWKLICCCCFSTLCLPRSYASLHANLWHTQQQLLWIWRRHAYSTYRHTQINVDHMITSIG